MYPQQHRNSKRNLQIVSGAAGWLVAWREHSLGALSISMRDAREWLKENPAGCVLFVARAAFSV